MRDSLFPMRRPLSTDDLPLLRAYIEAEVRYQVTPVPGPEGQGDGEPSPEHRAAEHARDEAWAKLEAGA